ncbi:uncharacterized protein LOC6580210 [Drosophila mojavensis]|nr:uncharacterized protein LOC6580210 [Drosophila mojavensis]
MCNTDGVSTKAPFPECCWKCVAYTNCEETGGAAGNGNAPAPNDKPPAAPGDAPAPPADPPAAPDAASRTMPKKGTKNRKAIDFKKY